MSKLEIIIKGMENEELRRLEKASECHESQFAQWLQTKHMVRKFIQDKETSINNRQSKNK